MHQLTGYLAGTSRPEMSILSSNPFGYLLKVGESEDVGQRTSSETTSQDGRTISDVQVRMMMWELEAYMNDLHLDKRMTKSVDDLGDHNLDTDGSDVERKTPFRPFTDLMTPKKDANSYFKKHPAKMLKLDRMCRDLEEENSRQVMTDLRQSVLSAEPAMKPEKIVEIFGKILADAQKKQKEAQAARKADPRNMNKLSAEYMANRLSHAFGNVTSFFAQHSAKVTPVVDFILGKDDDDDDDDGYELNSVSARVTPPDAAVNRGPGNVHDHEDNVHPFGVPYHADDQNGGSCPKEQQPPEPCAVRVADETKDAQPASVLSTARRDCEHETRIDLVAQAVGQNRKPHSPTGSNINNCANTTDTNGNDIGTANAGHGRVGVRVKSKPGRAMRNIRDAMSTEETFVDVIL